MRLVGMVLVVLAVAGCGGNEENGAAAAIERRQEIEAARKEGAAQARQEARIARLEAKVERQQRRERARKRAVRQSAPASSTGVSAPVGANPGASGATPTDFFTYYGPAFQAKLPQGAGWGSPAQSQPTSGELFRTSVRGPGGLFVIVDYTPFETAQFGGDYTSRTVVGQTAFGSATKYVFQGGTLPECQRSACVDYIINEENGGSGFAVLAGGPNFAAAASLAQTVAESVVPS